MSSSGVLFARGGLEGGAVFLLDFSGSSGGVLSFSSSCIKKIKKNVNDQIYKSFLKLGLILQCHFFAAVAIVILNLSKPCKTLQ